MNPLLFRHFPAWKHQLATATIALLFFASANLSAQTKIKLKNGCNFADRPAEQEYYIDKASKEAQQYVDEILGATSNPSAKNFEVRSCTFGNATATNIEVVENGKTKKVRYVLVNPDFIKDFEQDAQTKYAAYLVLAHEVGHHLLGHDFEEKDPDRLKEMELEADKFAGSVLCTLCSTLKEAKAGMEKLPVKAATTTHPPVSARLISISKGWNDQKSYWDSRGGRPCERAVPMAPTFGQKVCSNLAKNVHANVYSDRVEFIYDVEQSHRYQRILVYLNFSPDCELTARPTSIEWIDDRNIAGSKKKVVWHFTRDNYDRNDVLRPDDLGIVAFPFGDLPQPVKNSVYLGLGAIEAAGIGAVITGYLLHKDACETYDIYTENLNPAADIYSKTLQQTRTEVYQEANQKHKLSRWLFYGGAVVSVVNGYFLVKKIRKINCTRDMNPQLAGNTSLRKVSFEPFVFGQAGPGIGLRVRF